MIIEWSLDLLIVVKLNFIKSLLLSYKNVSESIKSSSVSSLYLSSNVTSSSLIINGSLVSWILEGLLCFNTVISVDMVLMIVDFISSVSVLVTIMTSSSVGNLSVSSVRSSSNSANCSKNECSHVTQGGSIEIYLLGTGYLI